MVQDGESFGFRCFALMVLKWYMMVRYSEVVNQILPSKKYLSITTQDLVCNENSWFRQGKAQKGLRVP